MNTSIANLDRVERTPGATYERAVATAKSGIWYRAKRSANPKGTILNTSPMAGTKINIRAYNEALVAAKTWARA